MSPHHQQVEPVDLDTDADLVALSFFSGFAAEAYRLADELRARGVTVVAGGPHATYWQEEALEHCDAVAVGEAEPYWGRLIEDAEHGRLEKVYRGPPPSLEDIPTPRYDLLPRTFFVPRVVQATRGCPFRCSFCTVPGLNPGFRTRPVRDVLADVDYDDFPHWWQRRVVWFWDDNLTARRTWIKELLREIVPRRRWWLTQVCVMAGFVAGFDGDDADGIVSMADRLQEIGIDVPFLSVLTPYRGTALYAQMEDSGRLLEDRGWEYYNGYNVTFRPERIGSDELLEAHRELWRRAFSPGRAAARVARGARTLRTGAFLMSAAMNGFYGLKRSRGNEPVDMRLAGSRHGAETTTGRAFAGAPTGHRPTTLDSGLPAE